MRFLTLMLAPAILLAQSRAPENESIVRQDLEADLHFLAGDSMRGRLTGSPEYLQAAKFLEARFRRLGLKPAGPENSFEHRFTLQWSELAAGNLVRLKSNGIETEATIFEDSMPLFFSPSAKAHGTAVFTGFGITAPALGWNDLQSPDLRGRILLMLEGEPGPDDPKSIFDGVVHSVHSDPMRKALNVQERGAAGVLFVNPRDVGDGVERFAGNAHAYWPDTLPHLKRYALTSQAGRLRIPVAAISQSAAQTLLGARSLRELVEQASRGSFPAVALDGEVEMTVRLKRHLVDDRSVVAKIEGSDPRLKNEAVIVSAHYDHNGAEGAAIYNGADDNGSGTVALLEIAEAYALAARAGQRPKRTVIFAAWGSEERCCGPLLGAWAWIERPPMPLDRTVAVLNMDMIGRSEEVTESAGARFRGLAVQTAASNANAVNIIGTSYSPDLRKSVTAANGSFDLQLRFRYDNNASNLLRRSDHWPFLNNGVPAIWFHTGLHPDYHTINDRPERIDYAKAERIARLVHQMSWDLAQQPSRPEFLKKRPVPEPD